MRRTKKQIHINRHMIAADAKGGTHSPIIALRISGKKETNGYQADILGPDGAVVASVIYRPDKPLPCGARAWIESYGEVRMHNQPAGG